ncbi:hypothetical protein DFH27DRAFT_488436 [Peziza echinospora]|nr:hypothetical protein DFH27DRAFT_488436 [Peziza echinospora]
MPVASGAPHRTGTLPFMSIGMLKSEGHTYRHHHESFLHGPVFISAGNSISDWHTSTPNTTGRIKIHKHDPDQLLRPST